MRDWLMENLQTHFSLWCGQVHCDNVCVSGRVLYFGSYCLNLTLNLVKPTSTEVKDVSGWKSHRQRVANDHLPFKQSMPLGSAPSPYSERQNSQLSLFFRFSGTICAGLSRLKVGAFVPNAEKTCRIWLAQISADWLNTRRLEARAFMAAVSGVRWCLINRLLVTVCLVLNTQLWLVQRAYWSCLSVQTFPIWKCCTLKSCT